MDKKELVKFIAIVGCAAVAVLAIPYWILSKLTNGWISTLVRKILLYQNLSFLAIFWILHEQILIKTAYQNLPSNHLCYISP